MCTATSSCTINEGKHFESVFVVAHEIGHKYFTIKFANIPNSLIDHHNSIAA